MPVLAVGGEKSFGATEAVVMRNVATNVREAVVPCTGHWLMEESPAFTIALIQDFLKDRLPKRDVKHVATAIGSWTRTGHIGSLALASMEYVSALAGLTARSPRAGRGLIIDVAPEAMAPIGYSGRESGPAAPCDASSGHLVFAP
jgi:hypothetical protein